MTITATPSTIGYATDGVTDTFAVPFPFDTAADLEIIITDADGTPAVQTTGFSVTGGGGSTGSVVFDTPPDSGQDLTISDELDFTQPADYTDNDAFPAETHERALDRVTRLTKRLYNMVQRALLLPAGDPTIGTAIPSVDSRKGFYLVWDSITGALTTAVLSATTMTKSVIISLLYPQSEAEALAGVVPTGLYPSDDITGFVDPRRYGVDTTGATNSQTAMNNAIAVLRKSSCRSLFIPDGIIKVTDLNLSDQYAMDGVSATDTNDGGMIFGTSRYTSQLLIDPAADNTGNGLVMIGCARWKLQDFWLNAANGASPEVLFLIGRGLQGGSGIFSGFVDFENMKLTSYGDRCYYNHCSEQTNFKDTEIDAVGPTSIAVTLSRANTAGISSAYAPLHTPGPSMTMVSFLGAGNLIQSAGPAAVEFDNGALGIGTFDFGTTYFKLEGATTAAFKDTALVGGRLVDIEASTAQVEFNGGAGTNQVEVLVSPSVENCHFHGYSAYGATAQTVPLFAHSGTWKMCSVRWVVNASGPAATPATMFQSTLGALGCEFHFTDAARSTISIGAACTATKLVCTDGVFHLGAVTNEGLVTNAVTYELQRHAFGGSQGTNRDGLLRGQKTTAVSNAAAVVILTFAIAGRARVTGVSSGKRFTEDVSFLYNTAPTVLTGSSLESGTPAARTYTCSNNTLLLQMGDATATNITVVADEVGGYGE
jgi:hypothetical protein